MDKKVFELIHMLYKEESDDEDELEENENEDVLSEEDEKKKELVKNLMGKVGGAMLGMIQQKKLNKPSQGEKAVNKLDKLNEMIAKNFK